MKNRIKGLSVIFGILLSLIIISGCSKNNKEIIDREGNKITLPNKIERIISTSPSNTEILIELGLKDKLVAVDTYSSDVEGIDEDFIKIDFLNPDIETIISLEPDIIISSANLALDTKDKLKLIEDAEITVVNIPSSNSLEGIYKDISLIAEITGREEKGLEVINNMEKEIEHIRKIGSKISKKKKVYFEIGYGTQLYSFGSETFLNEMIELVGAENIFKGEKFWISPSPEAIIEANPDVILTNFPSLSGVKAVDDIKSREGWEVITAIKNNDVYMIDTNASSRPSHNVIKALKEIAEAIYPNEYK
ncbi:ABC transporter substrate-binding protein [Caproiciproducens sp. MSJ-32]|uniref:ABC transporter substrate-binding protein n=1 Tax=Caproiciproducens sp. MSJ-32 TaxID=2841527 RepID=UPI001C11AF8D|nr:ABC transporter substrate-binding protein [Caproiciproducens sp. MSJ-32]MBU5453977.1 ABC transporter substrate-binding protein [Caproiciproducens sp. MSJ-32]